jgi:hypothetical protein
VQVSKRAIRVVRLTAIAFTCSVSLLALLGWFERERNKGEEYAVYSAYLSDEILDNFHDWSVDNPIDVVINDRTIRGGNLRFRLFYFLDKRARFPGSDTLTWASYLVRNLYQTRIEPKLSLPQRSTVRITSEQKYGSPEFQTKFPNNMGLVVLSGVGFNPSRSQAVFYVDHYCGLCGGGAYIFMEKLNGHWRVRDVHGTWIS